MKEKLTIQELIVRIAEKSGASKKVSTELIRVLPEIIESGLERDGEVRIAGLGTFRLKWVKARKARNLRTGAGVEVPAHNKVVFYPEKGLKEKVNKDFRYLTYQVVDEEVVSREEPVGQLDSGQLDKEEEVVSQELPVGHLDNEGAAETEEIPEYRRRKAIYWIIPLIFVIIALLVVIFYMKNCQDELRFTDKGDEEMTITPSVPPAGTPEMTESETTPGQKTEAPESTPPAEPEKAAPVAKTAGFESRSYTILPGKYLFQVARETYGNPFLWSLIYKENRDKLPDPQNVRPGIEIVIPSLEGMPSNLTRDDSTRVAEGYRLLYEYYNSKGDDRAKDYAFTMKSFMPR